MGSRDPNTGPRVPVTSTLPTKTFPQAKSELEGVGVVGAGGDSEANQIRGGL